MSVAFFLPRRAAIPRLTATNRLLRSVRSQRLDEVHCAKPRPLSSSTKTLKAWPCSRNTSVRSYRWKLHAVHESGDGCNTPKSEINRRAATKASHRFECSALLRAALLRDRFVRFKSLALQTAWIITRQCSWATTVNGQSFTALQNTAVISRASHWYDCQDTDQVHSTNSVQVPTCSFVP